MTHHEKSTKARLSFSFVIFILLSLFVVDVTANYFVESIHELVELDADYDDHARPRTKVTKIPVPETKISPIVIVDNEEKLEPISFIPPIAISSIHNFVHSGAKIAEELTSISAS